MKKIWMRVGMDVSLSDAAYKELVEAAEHEDYEKLIGMFEVMISNGRLAGETYILGKNNSGGLFGYDNPEEEISVEF